MSSTFEPQGAREACEGILGIARGVMCRETLAMLGIYMG
jgi:hypothetical protein